MTTEDARCTLTATRMDATIDLSGQTVRYRLRRSARRRTVGLTISLDRGLVVHAPERLTLRRVEATLAAKSRWILVKLAEAEAARRQQAEVSWGDGMVLPFRGRRLRVRVGTGPHGSDAALVRLADDTLWVSLPLKPLTPPERALLDAELPGRKEFGFAAAPGGGNASCATIPGRAMLRGAAPDTEPERLRAGVVAWLRDEAYRTIQARCAHFSSLLNQRPPHVRIKDTRSRWGSCSARGNLNFSWRLILAPTAVLDYVVVHELCHLVHLNHSPAFWSLVRRILPQFEAQRRWLRHDSAQLHAW